jgi:hypothetical protein
MTGRQQMTFVTMVEAVAHFFDMGYVTLDSSTTERRRVMYKPGDDQLLSPMVELRVGKIKNTDFVIVESRFL